MVRLVLAFILVVALAGCRPSASDPAPVAETTATELPAPTEAPTLPAPTAEPPPEPTSVPEPAIEPVDQLSGTSDYEPVIFLSDIVQDRGGVTIHILDVRLATLSEMPDEDRETLLEFSAWERAQTLGGIELTVTNTTDGKISVYPDQGTVVIGNEQIELTRFMMFSDSVGGDFYPGVEKSGVVLFGVERLPAEEITVIRYMVNAPSDEGFRRLADEGYTFVLER